MTYTSADLLVDILADWGVEVVFGMPGDGITGLIEAFRKNRDRIRFIQVRHEETAAFMACGYAKFTGRLGVCVATSGPGGIHLLNGLYDAKFDGQPVLAITGMNYHDQLSTHSQQDVELDKLFMDVCTYNARVMGPDHVEPLTQLACRTAIARKGVAHLTIPADFQMVPVNPRMRPHTFTPTAQMQALMESPKIPSEKELRRAADTLNSGSKVTILAGRGALGAHEELETLAEILGAPVTKALLGKACLHDDSIYTTGIAGLLGTRPSQEALDECDTLLLVGTSFPYLESLPRPLQARAVQIDADPARIGLRYPIEAALIGDCRWTLRELIPYLKRNENRAFLTRIQSSMSRWWQEIKASGSQKALPMKPQVISWELGKLLPDNAILACDTGSVATWWARQIPAKKGQMHSLSGTLATMACGLPYAMAAQIAYPDRPCVALIGDGAFTMSMGELATCVKYNLPIKIVVIKNNAMAQVKWEQMAFSGDPEYLVDLQPIDFSAFARACGAKGYTVSHPNDCSEILRQAMSEPGPTVIEAVVDALEMPQTVARKVRSARHLTESMARGSLNWNQSPAGIAKILAKEIV